ncbi:MAG: thiamine phosphate synthase [Cyanothece sp. SIO2G6]|nr:thiamine phosphate synthase [Cyanothece sp. SIO2G6]
MARWGMIEHTGQQTYSESAVHRILDANLDRAREGIRTIEEWCRFGLHQTHLTEKCKTLRQTLATWHTPELRASRNTPDDPGTDLTHPQEATRTDLTHLLQANFCRVQEALRVLEEYGKLYRNDMATASKQMRYEIYTMESELMGHHRHQKLLQSQLYLVTSPHEKLFSVVELALQGGLKLVQYRAKDEDDMTRVQIGQKLKQLCHQYDALFIVNDRVDLALAVDADGVHLGQQDMPLAIARQLLGPHRIIGRSTSNPKEMAQSLEQGADYIGVGPVHTTPTKPGKAAAGLEYVRHVAQHATVPWFAIGSVNTDNLSDVIDAGANRVAVVRAIMQAENPTLVTQYFIAQLAHGQRMRLAPPSPQPPPHTSPTAYSDGHIH